jgi:serine/threonine protein kinase
VTGQRVAIKFLRKDNIENYEKFSTAFLTELAMMRGIDHRNVLKLIDGSDNALLIKPDGRQYEVIYLALELAPNKELFDFVQHSGSFPENIARYYFR